VRDALQAHVRRVVDSGAGEVLIQSVDRDGTGNGLDLSLAEEAGSGPTPLILMGGVGQAADLSEGLRAPAVEAVATANLLNFIGSGLVKSRSLAESTGLPLAQWQKTDLSAFQGMFKQNPDAIVNLAGRNDDSTND
jgi:cyclase